MLSDFWREFLTGKKPERFTLHQAMLNKAMRWTIRDLGAVWKNYEKDDTESLRLTLKVLSGIHGKETVESLLEKNKRTLGVR